jgi:hypothetical protein
MEMGRVQAYGKIQFWGAGNTFAYADQSFERLEMGACLYTRMDGEPFGRKNDCAVDVRGFCLRLWG